MGPLAIMAIMAAVQAASSLASGALSDSGQEKEPFEGIDSSALMNDILFSTRDAGNRIGRTSYELPDAYVQTPPGYYGGGLPMPIGLYGTDPRAGVGVKSSDVVKVAPAQTGNSLMRRGPWQAGESNGTRTPSADAVFTGRTARRRYQPMFGATDDSDEAMSALEILRSGNARNRGE